MAYIRGKMPPSKDKKRFEVHLMPEIVKEFEKLSQKENRSIKNLMETILIKYAEEQKKKGK